MKLLNLLKNMLTSFSKKDLLIRCTIQLQKKYLFYKSQKSAKLLTFLQLAFV